MPLQLSLLAIITSSQPNSFISSNQDPKERTSLNNTQQKVFGKTTCLGTTICYPKPFSNIVLYKFYKNIQAKQKKFLFSQQCFKTTGMIYAMVHLRTNRIYVIATKRKLSTSFKQHWYSAYLRNTKFHRSFAKGKL